MAIRQDIKKRDYTSYSVTEYGKGKIEKEGRK